MEKSQKTRQKANRWSWGGTLQTNTPCTTAGTLTYITYITQYLLTHSTTHHRHSQLYSHFFPLCIGAHTPDACLCQCLSCINMSACLCVSVLFCHVYIWTFQIRCPLLLLRIHTLLCLSLFLSLPPLALKFKLSLSLTYSLSLPPTLGSLSTCSALFVFSAIVLSPPGPGFVESAFLYPLDLAGLEHMQSAFSLYYRYGMTSQCEYKSTVWVSWLALERWL